jgi:hypothetical protein
MTSPGGGGGDNGDIGQTGLNFINASGLAEMASGGASKASLAAFFGGGGSESESSDPLHIEFADVDIIDSGDASNDDVKEAAQAAADLAKQLVRSANSNGGMDALAELMDAEIDKQAEGLADQEEPDLDALLGAIAHVHSSGTAQSCMTEGAKAAYDLLLEAYEAIVTHEAVEAHTL